ncbi:unnamed protein product [Lota lota]
MNHPHEITKQAQNATGRDPFKAKFTVTQPNLRITDLKLLPQSTGLGENPVAPPHHITPQSNPITSCLSFHLSSNKLLHRRLSHHRLIDTTLYSFGRGPTNPTGRLSSKSPASVFTPGA